MTVSAGTVYNCFYLDGSVGSSGIPLDNRVTLFYKTSDDPEVITTASVVEALNSYIESNEDSIDTTGWCQWKIGKDNLPELDFNKEWNGTTWVTTNS